VDAKSDDPVLHFEPVTFSFPVEAARAMVTTSGHSRACCECNTRTGELWSRVHRRNEPFVPPHLHSVPSVAMVPWHIEAFVCLLDTRDTRTTLRVGSRPGTRDDI
jgi:hypothetical protein